MRPLGKRSRPSDSQALVSSPSPHCTTAAPRVRPHGSGRFGAWMSATSSHAARETAAEAKTDHGNLLRFCAMNGSRNALAHGGSVQAMREVEAILNDALDLPKAERARLVEKLTESLGPALGVAEAWAAEISQRIDRLREAAAAAAAESDDVPTRSRSGVPR